MKLKVGDKVKVLPFPKLLQAEQALVERLDIVGKIYKIEKICLTTVHLSGCPFAVSDYLLEKVEDMEEFKFGELVEVSNKTGEWAKRYYLRNYIGEVSGKNYYITFSKSPDYVADNGDLEYWTGIRKIKKEYSMQEIADALNIDVKDLRIKK